MNNSIKSNKPAILLASLITGYLIFSDYRKRQKKLEKTKKWVNWEIEFKKDTSADGKIKTLLAIDKFILDYLYKQNYFNAKRFSLNIMNSTALNIPDRFTVGISGNSGDTSMEGVATIIPKPRPHFPADILVYIENIKTNVSNNFF